MLVSGPAGPTDRSGIWILSLSSGELHKLTDDAMAGAALSPDQLRIVFRRTSSPGIWIMNATGEDQRKLLAAPLDGAHDARLAWFPDGRRIAYSTNSSDFSIENYDLSTGHRTVMLTDRKGGEFCLTADGRLIYTRLEDPPNEKSSNLWEVGYDTRSGQIRGSPVKLTNWSGFLFSSVGTSADGSRIFFLRLHYQNNVYVGELVDNGTRLTDAKRFSFEQWASWPTGWTRDGLDVFFNSDRDGQPAIFRQSITARDAVRLAQDEVEQRDARISPDGQSLLFLEGSPNQKSDMRGHLIRAGLDGGQKMVLFSVYGHSSPKRIDPLVSVSAEGHPAFRCPTLPSAACILSEERDGQIVFTAFDPIQGRKAEKLSVPASGLTFWDLSSDGRWIAFGRNDETNGRIRLASLAGEPSKEIWADHLTHLLSAAWSREGDALFVTAFASKGAPLVRVSMDGKTQILYRGLKYVENPVVSPDGRRIAFGEMTEDGNAWIMDSQPRR